MNNLLIKSNQTEIHKVVAGAGVMVNISWKKRDLIVFMSCISNVI